MTQLNKRRRYPQVHRALKHGFAPLVQFGIYKAGHEPDTSGQLIILNRVEIESLYLQNAAAYVARIENTEFFDASSCSMASVRSAVASTACGRLPRCFQTATWIHMSI